MQRTKVHTSCMADIPFGRRNRLHNGDFRVDQINAGAAVTLAASGYVADNGWLGMTQASKLTAQRVSGSANLPCAASQRLTVAAAYTVVAADYFVLQGSVEGLDFADLLWGTANAKPITVSFQVYVSAAGTYSFCIKNAAGTYSYVFTAALLAGANSITATIPGCTVGVWPIGSAKCLSLVFDLGSGATWRTGTTKSWVAGNFCGATGAACLVSTLGAVYEVSSIQIEAGRVATPFEFLPYQQALAWCQRYYSTSYSAGILPGTTNTASSIVAYAENTYDLRWGGLPFPTQMRALPTVTLFAIVTGAAGNLYDWNSAVNRAASANDISTNGFRVLFNTGAAVAGHLMFGNWVADARM